MCPDVVQSHPTARGGGRTPTAALRCAGMGAQECKTPLISVLKTPLFFVKTPLFFVKTPLFFVETPILAFKTPLLFRTISQ